MFIDAEYLVRDANAPDTEDDPLLEKLLAESEHYNERWLRLRLDLSDINEIAELGLEDRCMITYFNGLSRIVRYSYERMITYHNELFLTLEQMKQATYEIEQELDEKLDEEGQFFGDNPDWVA